MVMKVELPSPEFQHFLYRSIGGKWFWYLKAQWTYRQWMEVANNPKLHTWVGYQNGTPAGYFQLLETGPDVINIEYFGLMQNFIGQGLGGHLLSCAVHEAFNMGAKSVTVNTCTLDHEGALQNYKSRGFAIYKTESFESQLPEQTPGPWDGAFSDLKIGMDE